MEGISLIALLLGGLAVSAVFSLFDNDDDGSSDAEEGVTVDGTEGDDVLSVEGDDDRDWDFVRSNDMQLSYIEDLDTGEIDEPDASDGSFDDVPGGVTVVDPGAGSDTITLSGEDVYLEAGGAGADLIDASNLGSGYLVVDDESTIEGSDVANADVTYAGGSFVLNGGEASEYAFSSGSTAMEGGGGNDTLVAGGRGSLSGGDGDDVLDGSYGLDRSPTGGATGLESYTNEHPNILDGGAGDDRIYFDNQDMVYGGEGADLFIGFEDIYVDHGSQDHHGLADFDPDEDQLIIWVNNIDDITLSTHDGTTYFRTGDDPLLRIEGHENLVIGYYFGEPQIGIDEDYSYYADNLVDADGNPIGADEVDMIIAQYPAQAA